MSKDMSKWNKIRSLLGLHPIETSNEELKAEWLAFVAGTQRHDCTITSNDQFIAFETGYKLHGNFDMLSQIGSILATG